MDNGIATRLTEVIDYIKETYGVSQKEISDKVGVNENTLGKWKKGASFPCADDLQALMQHYSINANYIINGQKPMLQMGANLVSEPTDSYGKNVSAQNELSKKSLADKERIIQLMESQLKKYESVKPKK